MDMDAAPMLKRKGAEAPELWLDDGASGFPLASRATKLRRLDSDVPLIVPGAGVPAPPQPDPLPGLGVEEVRMCGDAAPVDVLTPAANEERAIVLYKPAEAARNLLLGPLRPEIPLRVSPDWIHGLKNTMLQEASSHRALFEGLATDVSSSLAMVPWAPSQPHSQAVSTAATVTEMMDAEDGEGASMEVEQDRGDQFPTAGPGQGEALQQWPQHCMVPQPLPTASYQPSPVTWSW